MYLIAAVSDPTWLGWSLIALKVLIGLGMVIFVHELGHFLVAKLCGVKCEKFYLGFDFFGLKIWKFRYGETEYGIGVFPLGGYVKMLGQEDNPARLKEELERAKAAQASPAEHPAASEEPAPAETAEAGQPPSDQIDLEAAEQALYDPRSYLAQSVPKRMAIISAGVIMNVIFAFFMAVVAYGLGVQQQACAVGEVVPGKAAWKANIVSGDRILEIAGKPVDRFQELRTGISLGDVANGLSLVVQRPGRPKPFEVTVFPSQTGPYPTIGVSNPYTSTLGEELPALPGSAAAKARPALRGGDTIVTIGQVAVAGDPEVRRQLALHPDVPLAVTVLRGSAPQAGEDVSSGGDENRAQSEGKSGGARVTIEVAPQPACSLGLVMEMGPITAVQDDSPAQKAGVKEGDVLVGIDGQSPGDPMTLGDRLRRLAGRTIALAVRRDGKEVAIEGVRLRRADFFATPFVSKSPVSVPALGIACSVRNKVAAVVQGSPAAREKVAQGEMVVGAKILPPDEETLKREGLEEAARLLEVQTVPVNFTEDEQNWPYLMTRLQNSLPGTRVELTLQNGRQEQRTVTLEAVAAADGFDPLRGFVFEWETFTRKARSPGEAVDLGYTETVDSLLLIWRSLEKLSSGQVSAKKLVGPVGIIQMAGRSAAQGTGELLIFLTVLSANLAILNFLPIPVLDGGHMVFLAYEGIRGKPPSEGVFLTLSYLGLVFILGLMVWVIGLDLGRLLGF